MIYGRVHPLSGDFETVKVPPYQFHPILVYIALYGEQCRGILEKKIKDTRTMKKIFYVTKEIVITLVVLFMLMLIIGAIRKPKLTTDSVPNVAVTLIDGEQFHYQKDKPLMIHFWGTWCPVCELEAPNIDTAAKHYQVLTIANNSGSNKDILEFLKEKGVSYPVYNDKDGNWSRAFHLSAFPTTLIYDSHGKLKYTDVGYTTTAGLLARMKMAE